MTDRDAAALVASHRPWYHRIEVAPGVVTPGTHNSPLALKLLDGLGLPADCTGMRALDVGCRDGFFTAELERRGAAEVVPVDSEDEQKTGFPVVKELLGLRSTFRRLNAYDLAPERVGTFDLVLFLGVLYHLRHPLLALDALRSVSNTGATVLLTTEVATGPAGDEATSWSRYYRLDSFIAGGTTKWVPNPACLEALLVDALFDVQELKVDGDRAFVRAVAVRHQQASWMLKQDQQGRA